MPPGKSLKKNAAKKDAGPNRGSGHSDSTPPGREDDRLSSIPIRYITSMLDNAQEAIVIMQDKIHKYVNKRASEIDGRPIGELIGKHMRETTHPDDYRVALQSYQKKLAGKPVDKYRYRGVNKKGEVIWLEIIGTAVLWEGRPAVINFVTDVTKQVEAEEALKKSERILADIVSFLPEPTFAVDREGRIIIWNREMEKMMGVKSEHMIGKSNYEHALPFYGRRIPMLIDMVRNPRKRDLTRYSFFRKENNFLYAEHSFQLHGETRWLRCKASPIYDHNNRLIGAIESMQDITEFRNAVSELKDKSLHLEEANTALKVLLEHRTNDRNEMEGKIAGNVKNLITPYLNKLKISGLDKVQQAYIDILESHLNEIVSPFLTNLTAGRINLTPREIQIADLVKEGKSAKEISQILNIAVHTANNYRKRLRKKFSLEHKNKNLRAHLLSFK
jgi:PAS domain S-box-containing protein